jgi:hypothetical protein
MICPLLRSEARLSQVISQVVCFGLTQIEKSTSQAEKVACFISTPLNNQETFSNTISNRPNSKLQREVENAVDETYTGL